MFKLRGHLGTLHNGICSVRIDILSILNQISIINSQKLTPALLNPLDLISLMIKMETQLMLHLRLALPKWNGENLWYMYKFMTLQSFMMLNALYVVLHNTLDDKSLQFHLFRIHNIPSVHPILRKSFRYSIQDGNFTFRMDEQYISFPLWMDIVACQVWNRQFCQINSPCVQQILQTLAINTFSTRTKIKLIHFAPCQS